MNWGIKIIIGMSLAMTAVVVAGIYMVSHDHDTLEETDYYERGLAYDADYTRKMNVNQKNNAPDICIGEEKLLIKFSGQGNKGQLLLRRPSDQSLDRIIPFAISGQTYQLRVTGLKAGSWQLRLEWEQARIPFLYEQNLILHE